MEGFLLVGFRGLRFPGPDGRLRPALPVDDGFDRWNWGFERAGPDLALRYAHYIGAWDVGLSYFYGTGREPRLVFAPNLMTLQTEYETIHQGGLDLQLTTDAWLSSRWSRFTADHRRLAVEAGGDHKGRSWSGICRRGRRF